MKTKRRFDYYVVYDFEATCDEVKAFSPQLSIESMMVSNPRKSIFLKEIIEFSCVVVDASTLHIWQDGFQEYARPTVKPILTPFCTQLTGIEQDQVAGGSPLKDVLQRHDEWLRNLGVLGKGKSFVPVTWTDWDLEKQLHSECLWRKIEKPAYYNQWINLKKIFCDATGRTMRLEKAVEYMDLKWEGRKHCGLDDARNTARLLVKLALNGTALNVTGRMSAAHSILPFLLRNVDKGATQSKVEKSTLEGKAKGVETSAVSNAPSKHNFVEGTTEGLTASAPQHPQVVEAIRKRTAGSVPCGNVTKKRMPNDQGQ